MRPAGIGISRILPAGRFAAPEIVPLEPMTVGLERFADADVMTSARNVGDVPARTTSIAIETVSPSPTPMSRWTDGLPRSIVLVETTADVPVSACASERVKRASTRSEEHTSELQSQ